MGCGKSKHDVASDNTILQRKKSSVNSKAGQENGTETKGISNNKNVDNVRSEVEQKNNENVKERGVGGIGDESNGVKGKAPEITNVQEDKALEKKSKEADGAEGKTQEIVVAEEPSKKDDSLKENDAPAAAEEKKAENEKEDVSLKEETLVKEEETKDVIDEETLTKEEETKGTNQEETLTKEDQTKDTNVATSEGEEKNLKAEQGQ